MAKFALIACDPKTGVVLDTTFAWFVRKEGQTPFRLEFETKCEAITRYQEISATNLNVEFWLDREWAYGYASSFGKHPQSKRECVIDRNRMKFGDKHRFSSR